ncbi:MAG: glycosyltransferase family 2 protein [Chloroflexota bacterium]|nr:MAG: glycosyltransferase family 2 protein [Chloroflexota bacterium]
MPELAIIIVTWNVRQQVLDALDSLYADLNANGPAATVYVVDNHSADGTADAVARQFPQARLLALQENLGFVRGNNYALREIGFDGAANAALPRAVYLLNPDTITTPGATRALYDALLRENGPGLVGARLTFGDGSFQHSAFRFPGLRQLWVELFPTPGRLVDSPFNGRYPREHYLGEQPFEVDFVLGATMMLRAEVVQQTGLLDEGFFMYCEEIDWAWRIRAAGWRVECVPAAHVVHLGGQSTGQARPESVLHLWTSRLRLYRKHLPPWKAALARLMIGAGMRRLARTPGLDPALADVYRTIATAALKR